MLDTVFSMGQRCSNKLKWYKNGPDYLCAVVLVVCYSSRVTRMIKLDIIEFPKKQLAQKSLYLIASEELIQTRPLGQ